MDVFRCRGNLSLSLFQSLSHFILDASMMISASSILIVTSYLRETKIDSSIIRLPTLCILFKYLSYVILILFSKRSLSKRFAFNSAAVSSRKSPFSGEREKDQEMPNRDLPVPFLPRYIWPYEDATESERADTEHE